MEATCSVCGSLCSWGRKRCRPCADAAKAKRNRSSAHIAERIRGNVVLDEGGCWLWQGKRNEWGYGRFSVAGRREYVHRASYQVFVGPILDGLTIDHLCRNPGCVNPAHLEPVTLRVNILRGVGVTARQASQTHCKNGHRFDECNTYYRPGRRRGRHCRKCHAAANARYRARAVAR